MNHTMYLEEFKAWQRVFRDFMIVAVGTFILIYETVWKADPNPYLIAAGLTALGLPPAIRLDSKLRRQTPGGEEEEDDRWSHLP